MTEETFVITELDVQTRILKVVKKGIKREDRISALKEFRKNENSLFRYNLDTQLGWDQRIKTGMVIKA